MVTLIPNVIRRHPNQAAAMTVAVQVEDNPQVVIAEAILEPADGPVSVQLADVFEQVAAELRRTQGGGQ